MIKNLKSGSVGFAFGIAVAAIAAQAAQPTQHDHPTAPSAQAAPSQGKEQMHKMMSDPAMREKMMANMAQCRDMMSMMMDHMKREGMKTDKPTSHQ